MSTRETINRPFIELGVMFGQALGGREPVMQALTNLQSIGQEHGCDAVIAVKLLHYPTTAGPAVVAYGTGIKFLPPAESPAPVTPGGASASNPARASGVASPDGALSATGSPTGPPAAGDAGTAGAAAEPPVPAGRAAAGGATGAGPRSDGAPAGETP